MPLPPLPMQPKAESWAPATSGAVTAAGTCTKVAQSVALLLGPMLPLRKLHKAEGAPARGGAITAAGSSCTEAAQSEALLLKP